MRYTLLIFILSFFAYTLSFSETDDSEYIEILDVDSPMIYESIQPEVVYYDIYEQDNIKIRTVQKNIADYKFTIQIGSFVKFDNALKLYQKALESGFNVYMNKTKLKGKTFHRVRIGFYDDLDTTRYTKDYVEKNLNIDAIIINK